ncbi:hypothetical protein H4Q26_009638 [Puccinia striiformis f. sp. tritici PST-130]|nr:hypothetical protein H4Q26_009638 [Puccinia striiformis f. sp. tritici PST-130]
MSPNNPPQLSARFVGVPQMGLRPPNGVAKKIQALMHSNVSHRNETSSQSPRAQKKATSSNAPSVATGANGEPQGKDLHSIASRITSPEIHLTSRISQRHDDLSNGAREYQNSSFDAQQHETSSQSPRAQKKATSSNAPSVATGANGEPQGKDLHSIASRITSPEIHLTSRISQRHDDLSNGAREYRS